MVRWLKYNKTPVMRGEQDPDLLQIQGEGPETSCRRGEG